MNKNQALKFKEQGNEAFLKNDFNLAIQNYSQAIICESDNSILFSNRARAYKQVQKYQEAYNDAQKAIQLDNSNIKAHLISGQSLAQIGKSEQGTKSIQKAIQDMTKALTLCAGQNKQNFEKDLMKYIFRAKKLLYFRNQEIEEQDFQNQKQQLKDTYQDSLSKDQLQQIIEKRINKYQYQTENLKLSLQKKNYEVPEHLCCPITMNLFEDPVITQYGFSYERQALLEHYSKNNETDPIARKPINRNIPIISNLSLKKTVQEFLNNEPWSYEHYLDQNTIETIEF